MRTLGEGRRAHQFVQFVQSFPRFFYSFLFFSFFGGNNYCNTTHITNLEKKPTTVLLSKLLSLLIQVDQ